ncbi:MAG: MFS transporter [Pseudomonadota bacterium]
MAIHSTAILSASQKARSSIRPWTLVALLMLAMVFSIIDRQVLALLVEPIKDDLALSDTELGVLLGPAFVSCYLLFGLPFGWAADRFPRRYVIALGVGIWCLATITCGLVGSFALLVVARALVGAGEAALTPSSMSMLSDVFPRERMPLVTSVLSIAMHLGAASAFLVGGLVVSLVGEGVVFIPFLGELSAWRMTFVVVGTPGLALVAVFLLIREPLRTGTATTAENERNDYRTETAARSLRDFYRANRQTLNVHMSVSALLTLSTYAFVSWAPSYLMRVHNASTENAAFTLGLVSLICGPLGALGGGVLSTRLHRNRGRDDAPWIVMATSALGAALFGALAFTTTNKMIMFPFVALAMLFGSLYLGVIHGALQMITPAHLKGQMAAIMLMAMTGIGTTLGPVTVALLTDQVFRDPLRVGHSIALVSVAAGLVAGYLLLRNLTSFQSSYRKVASL